MTARLYTRIEIQNIKARALRIVGKSSDDDKFDFMQDCIDQLDDEDLCEILWEENGD